MWRRFQQHGLRRIDIRGPTVRDEIVEFRKRPVTDHHHARQRARILVDIGVLGACDEIQVAGLEFLVDLLDRHAGRDDPYAEQVREHRAIARDRAARTRAGPAPRPCPRRGSRHRTISAAADCARTHARSPGSRRCSANGSRRRSPRRGRDGSAACVSRRCRISATVSFCVSGRSASYIARRHARGFVRRVVPGEIGRRERRRAAASRSPARRSASRRETEQHDDCDDNADSAADHRLHGRADPDSGDRKPDRECDDEGRDGSLDAALKPTCARTR